MSQVVYQIIVTEKKTRELLEVGSLYATKELAEKEKKYTEMVYSNDFVRVSLISHSIVES